MLSKLMSEHLKINVDKIRRSEFLKAQRDFELKIIEQINKKHGWREVSDCPLCNSSGYTREFDKYGIALVKCNNCQLRYHTRIPADPNDIYQDKNYQVSTKEDSEEHFRYRKERFGAERVSLLERHCGNLSGKKILDIGCGNGFFLAAAKETGAICVGSEFSKKLRKTAIEKTKIPVYEEPLDRFPEKDFDIITIFDVIEHIQKPVPFILDVVNLLKVGGHILIYTPNFDSFSVRVMKEYSSIVDPKEHIILFSYSSIVYLGNLVGLKILYTETRGLDINNILAYQMYLGNKVNEFLADWREELQAMIDASGAADYFRVIYKKPI